jgi:hypothetical protein
MINRIAEAQKRIMYWANKDVDILENVALTLEALAKLDRLLLQEKDALYGYKKRAGTGDSRPGD